MKHIFIILTAAILAVGCGGGNSAKDDNRVEDCQIKVEDCQIKYVSDRECISLGGLAGSSVEIKSHKFENGLGVITFNKPITAIPKNAFSKCVNLKSITIPSSVTSIGEAAFSDCKNLTSVTIPNSVTSIGKAAFSNCESLTSVIIPNSVTSIGDYTFKGCTALTSVTIPNSVTSIGEAAFYDCKNLTITIPNSVTSLGNNAFTNCASQTITIPDSITEIGGKAFSYCDSVEIYAQTLKEYEDRLAENRKLQDKLKTVDAEIEDIIRAQVLADEQVKVTQNMLKAETEVMVKQSAVLRARDITMAALNANGNEVTRIKNAKKLRIDFTIGANNIAAAGNRNIYLCLISPDGYLLSTDAMPAFDYQGSKKTYSVSREIDYQNEDVNVGIFFSYGDNSFIPGTYKIELYMGNSVLGTAEVYMR